MRMRIWMTIGCILVTGLLAACTGGHPLAQNNSAESFADQAMTTSSFEDRGVWTIFVPAYWQERYAQVDDYPRIQAIVAGLDGAVWFATAGGPASPGDGVFRFDGQTWAHFSQENGLPFGEVSAMAVTPDGAVWFGSFGGGVTRFDGESWATYTTENGLAGDDIRALAVAPDGKLWAGTSDRGVAYFDGTRWVTVPKQEKSPDEYVGMISPFPDSTLLFSSSSHNHASLIQYDGVHWQAYPTPWGERGRYTMDVAVTSDGDIWFATEFNGVYRLAGGTWTKYTQDDGLPGDQVCCVEITADGSVWLGTNAGPARFDGEHWLAFVDQGHSTGDWITAMAAQPDGSIWIGTTGRMIRYVPAD